MQAKLVTLGEEGTVREVYPVDPSGSTYGRAGGDLVQIDDPEVSRRHFSIRLHRGEWQIVDLASKNGTWVNDARVQSAVLQHGDKVKAGRTALHFVLGEEGDAPVPGQPIDIGTHAYRRTMEHRSAPRSGGTA
jgi:pSer/pThr/pTyr-binding forkhead associated (FHA) protein